MCKCWPIWLLSAALLVTLITVLATQNRSPQASTPSSTESPSFSTIPQIPALKIGLIPERDIFAQRERYRALADYLQEQLKRPVELVTARSYQAILADFADGQIDAAFLGSLVASLAFDRYDAQPLVKPEVAGGVSTYRGVIFVRNESPIKSLDDLAGKTIAMVKTTTAGDLYPLYLLHERGLYDSPSQPRIAWVGTHDDVVMQVIHGNVHAGAAKNLRLDALEKTHSDIAIRRLAVSKAVPNNALVLRKQETGQLGDELADILLNMNQSEQGKLALAQFGAERFLPCDISEYTAIYEMVESLGSHWNETEINGPTPMRPGNISNP